MSGTIFLGAAEVSIGENGNFAIIPFRRTGDLSFASTITYSITPADGTNPALEGPATVGADYTGTGGTVTFAAGQDAVSIQVPIINDTLSERTEIFAVSMVSISSGEPGFPRTTRVYILDDENPVTPPIEPPLASDYTVTFTTLQTGFSGPLKMEFHPLDGTQFFLAEKGGRIILADLDGSTPRSTVLDIQSRVNSNSDRGLMDIALHPNLTSGSPYLYAFYVVDPAGAPVDSPDNRYAYVSRFTLDAGTGFRTIVPGSEVILVGGAGRGTADISGGGRLNFTDPALTIGSNPSSERFNLGGQVVVNGLKQNYIAIDSQSHAGGSLGFGPDGNLYISIGDGTSYNYADPRTWDVQNLDSLKGKILRVDPITGLGLPDNPFASSNGPTLSENRDKVFQLGVRNPFSMAITDDGRVVTTDTGWFSWEELNIGRGGANFGWPGFEGGDLGVLIRTPTYRDQAQAAAFYAAVANGTTDVTPAWRAFSHDSAAPGYQFQAIVGGDVVYDGGRYPAIFQNDYFFTNIVTGETYSVDVNDQRELKFLADRGMIHYTQGPDGWIYYVDIGGNVGRLGITGGPSGVNQPPVAGDDVASAFRGVAQLINVLANDTDANGDPLRVTDATSASGAPVVINTDFTLRYTAGASTPATDTITYTVSDGRGGFDTGLVRVSVSAPPPPGAISLVLNGDATRPSPAGDITLTPGAAYAAGNAMSNARIDMSADFVIRFSLNFGALEAGADGMAFVLHNDPRGAAALGGDGSGRGVSGTGAIVNGFAIEFDTYNNGGPAELAADHANFFDPDGAFATVPVAIGPGGQVEDGLFHPVEVRWNAATRTISYTVDGVVVGTLVRDISTDFLGGSQFAYFGIGAGTGGAFNTQVLRFTSFSGRVEGQTANPAPTVAAPIPDRPATEDAAFTYTLAAGTFADPGDTLTLSATRADGSALPTWLTFSAATGAFSGTPANADVGPLTVRVNAVDSAGNLVSDDFVITVANTNDAPTVTAPIADQNAVIGTPFGFAVPASAFTDVDVGDVLTYTATLASGAALPSWLAFSAATRTFSGTPAASDLGAVSVRVSATDAAGATIADEFNITVATTPPPLPVLNLVGGTTYDAATREYTLTRDGPSPAGAAMSTQRIDIRQNFEIRFDVFLGAKDVTGADGVTFVLHDDPRGASAIGSPFAGGSLSAGGIVRGLAIEFDTFDNGAAAGDVAADHTNFFDTDGTFRTTAFALPNIEDNRFHAVVVTWNAATNTLSYTFDGVAAPSLTRSLSADFFGGSSFVHFGFTGAVGGLTNLQEVRLTGLSATLEGGTPPPNVAPVANPDTASAVRGTPVAINVLANDTDANGDALSVTSATAASGATVTINPDRTITYLANAGAPTGTTDTITYAIADGRGGTSSSTVSVTVSATLPPLPTLNAVGGATFDAATGEYTLTRVGPNPPGGAMSNPRVDMRQDFRISFDIFLGASDAGADGATFLLHNDPRGAAAVGAAAAGGIVLGTGGITNAFAIEFDTWDNGAGAGDIAADHTNFFDPDGTFRTTAFSLGNVEDGRFHSVVVVWDADTRTLSYTVDGVAAGTITRDLVTDFLGGSSFAHFGFTAATGGASNLQEVELTGFTGTLEGVTPPANVAPVANPDVASAVRETPVVIAVLANDTDANGDALSVTSATAASGAVVTINADRTITYTATTATPAGGTDTITYAIADGRGGTASSTVAVTVSGVSPPIPPPTAANPGSLTVGGAGAFDRASGEFTLTPDTIYTVGTAMSQVQVDLRAGFEIRFDVFLGTKDATGADGVAFLLHNDPRGAAAIGDDGRGFGVLGIDNGIGIEFDTFDNGDGLGDTVRGDHTNFFDTDTFVRVGSTPSVRANLEDGAWHPVVVQWTPGTPASAGVLTYTLDGVTGGTLTGDIVTAYLGGSPLAYFGFGAATGGFSNLHEVRLTGMQATIAGTAPIRGGTGADLLVGQAVANTFDGGAGPDTLTGGGGSDVFVFTAGFGVDVITDFGDVAGNQDLIDLRALGISGFAALAPTQVGADTLITLSGGNSIRLLGFTVSGLGPDDFIF